MGTANLAWDPTATRRPFNPGAVPDPHPDRGHRVSGAAAPSPSTSAPVGDAQALRQFAGQSSVAALSQDGSALGTLQSFTIGQDGIVTGVFSNGRTRPIGQIALAGFANPPAWRRPATRCTGPASTPACPRSAWPAPAAAARWPGGTLEMSNVDLAQEFTNLIIAQRGFQANSRVITASDELLQDLVNLKR